MARTLALLSIPAALALVAPACGTNTCGGKAPTDNANAPTVSSFSVLSKDQQIPGDPWTVVFGVHFADLDGDLGVGGRAEFYLNSNVEPMDHELDQVFRQNGLLSNATEGAFWVHLRFAEATVDDGTQVRLGIQLVDTADLRSNCYTLDLKFDVYPAASLERSVPAWSVASTRCSQRGRS
jgi:hypothetical protein